MELRFGALQVIVAAGVVAAKASEENKKVMNNAAKTVFANPFKKPILFCDLNTYSNGGGHLKLFF